MRKMMSGLIGAAVLLGTGVASAQAEDFGKQGTAAFGADRLFAIHATRMTTENPGPGNDRKDDYTGFGFGWRGPIQPSPFDVPRFSFDYFIIDSLSLGGSLAYASLEHDDNDDNTNDEDDSAFLFAPRVGYVWMLGGVVGFWLRGGFTYHSYSRDPGNDESGLAFTVEPMFLFSPVEHFAFMAGPTFDIDITGEVEDDPQDRDRHYRSIGIQFGIMGWI